MTISRYVTKSFAYDPLDPMGSLKRAIRDSAPDALIACDDRAVALILRLLALVRGKPTEEATVRLIERSLGAPALYDNLLSRCRSLATLQGEGIRVAETFAVADSDSLAERLAEVGAPAVLKADGSWGGDGVAIVHNLEEAMKAFARLSSPPSRFRSLVRTAKRRDLHHLAAALAPQGRAVSIQKFIPGKPAASAFAAWNGEVVGSIYYDVLVADGRMGPPNVIRRVECPEIDAVTRAAARCFGLSGIHGIDFIRDDEGHVHVIEINPRATQGGSLPFGAGHDLPAALAKALWQQTDGMRDAIANDVVAFFPREWRRDPASTFLKSGHHDVPWDDPKLLAAVMSA